MFGTPVLPRYMPTSAVFWHAFGLKFGAAAAVCSALCFVFAHSLRIVFPLCPVPPLMFFGHFLRALGSGLLGGVPFQERDQRQRGAVIAVISRTCQR